jgi:hypothetical protein
MSTPAHCGICGVPLPPSARFCKACGSAVAPPQPPPPPPPPPAEARSPWLLALAALAAVATVAAVIVVLALADGGAGNGVRSASPAPSVISLPAPTAPPSSEHERTKALATSVSQGALITAAVPRGWHALEREAHKPGYIESKWEDPYTPGVTVLVDTSPATADTLEQDAAPVHEALERLSDYSQLYYGPGDLTGLASWKWTFRDEGGQRVDYFFNRCASGYAALGSAPLTRFASFERVFRAFAESVRPTADPGC